MENFVPKISSGLQRNAIRSTRARRQAREQHGLANKPTITAVNFVGMLVMAVFFDAIQALFGLFIFGVITAFISIIVSGLTTLAAWLIYFVWFGIIGVTGDVKFFARAIGTSMVSFLVELMGAGFVPTITIGIIVLFVTSRSIEKLEKTTGALK